MKFSLKNNQIILTVILALAAIMMTASDVNAQIGVRLEMNKRTYLVNEPVKATIQITNQTGAQLTLRGTKSNPWIMFNVMLGDTMVPRAVQLDYNSVVIPMGQTFSREVVLSSSYALSTLGHYSCVASINMPGTTGNAISSNRDHFIVSTGRIFWSDRAGVPGASSETREFRLISFSGNRDLELFAEVHSVNRNRHMATIPFGTVLNYNNLRGVLDRANTLHVLYQVRPAFYVHANISLDGKVISSAYIKRGTGTPVLTKLGDGSVMVTGGSIYDPAKEVKKAKKIHNASDRPSNIYN